MHGIQTLGCIEISVCEWAPQTNRFELSRSTIQSIEAW